MSKKIYVGNMSYSNNEADIKELFSQFGEVTSVKIVMDHYSGKSKGFGFVEMANDADAQNAIQNLNGKELNGRALKVNEAMEKPDRRNNQGGGGGGNFRRNNRY